ncbi:MAG: ferritin [Anaerolineaceae bacterium]|nr:ferritin [Anaerolineaceae bacterium]
MKISKELNYAINAQIGHELLASNIYINMAAYFNGLGLLRLSEMFFKQSEEEREHALKFIHYLLDVEGDVAVPALDEPRTKYDSVKQAFEKALEWEKEVTSNINDLMSIAIKEKDYASQDFLRWFVTEQVEEEATMSHLVLLAEGLGDRSVFMLESLLPRE